LSAQKKQYQKFSGVKSPPKVRIDIYQW